MIIILKNSSKDGGMDRADIRKLFRELRIPLTAQRIIIFQTFLSLNEHIGALELYSVIRKKYPKIGLATVYRTLQVLKEKGLVQERDFGEGMRRYENAKDSHHDHLVCIRCGDVIEFDEPAIEELQKKVARKNRFLAVHHRLELYGYCERCASRSRHVEADT